MMMENKMTAMQTLMEWMIEASQVIPVDPQYVYEKAEELLAMEKEQIINSYYEGKHYGFKEQAEQYYEETYGKQDN
jgi:hypothetical protein